MSAVTFGGRTYPVDNDGFLLDFEQWDEQFATGTAAALGNTNGLIAAHWKVVYFIRRSYEELGKCPLVYQICEANDIDLEELERLFPDGCHRGAVKIAGLRVR